MSSEGNAPIGLRIQSMRDHYRGLTRKQLATKILKAFPKYAATLSCKDKVAALTVQIVNWEEGVLDPPKDFLRMLSRALCISVAWLQRGSYSTRDGREYAIDDTGREVNIYDLSEAKEEGQ